MDDPFLQSREWRAVHMRALERDGAKCACCGATAANDAVMNVDHIKPRGRYPELALTLENLQVLCNACNHGKGNVYETDWRRHQAPAGTVPARRLPAIERYLIINVLACPAEACSPLYDQYSAKDRAADERCLAALIASVRADPGASTAALVQAHAEEFGDILAKALAVWETECRAPVT